jgi:methanesulfonate monooxygenase small subunit
VRTAVEELVYRTCLALDANEYERYLALCTPDFRYAVKTHSPEIRRDMVWLDHDRAGMEALFRTLPRHRSTPARLSRHATVYTVEFDAAREAGEAGEDSADGTERTRATVVTGLLVFRTAPDGGATSLYATGKLHDAVDVQDGKALLARRTVLLDTRELGIGTHIPF